MGVSAAWARVTRCDPTATRNMWMHAVARALPWRSFMRTSRAPALLLLTLLSLSPSVRAAKPETAKIVIAAASELSIEIAELSKDGGRRSTTLTLLLPDNLGQRGFPTAELKTRVEHSERLTNYYWARVQPETTATGTRYQIDVRRASDGKYEHTDMRMEVTRVLPGGVPTQLGRVTRPDGSSLIVTATLR